jgi:predicted nuclease of predicted toxin-antitoxin system
VRLLLDEQLSPAIAEQLRARSHDVVSAAEVGLAGAADERVLASAARDRRAVVTNNIKDFRPMHADYLKTDTTHYGIVFIPTGKYGLRRDQLGSLITVLDGLLVQLPADDAIRDREYFL